MSKKADILTLMFIMLSTGMFWYQSCTDYGEDKPKSNKEVVAPNPTKESIDIEKNKTYARVREYMLDINGYNSYLSQLNSSRDKSQDSIDIIDIKSKYTLGGTIMRHVVDAGIKILDKSYSDIASVFAQYNIPFEDRIISDEDEFAIIANADNHAMDVTYCYKPDMVFIGAADALYSDMGPNFGHLIKQTALLMNYLRGVMI